MMNSPIQDVFVLTYSCMKHYQGAWHMEKRLLFPEYVFLESDALPSASALSRTEERETRDSPVVEALKPEEEEFLRQISQPGHHVEMSKGYIKSGKTFVTEGPLYGKEPYIRRIDRHKRLAKLELPMSHGREIQVGLEIYRKE